MSDYIRPIWNFKGKSWYKVIPLKVLLTFLTFIAYPFIWYIGEVIERFPYFIQDWKYDIREYKKVMGFKL